MEDDQKEVVKQNLFNINTWVRLLFVILYAFVYLVAKYIVFVLALINAISNLLTGSNFDRITEFAKQMNVFLFQCLEYITFVSDAKPYPFKDWASKEQAENIHNYVEDIDS